MKVSLKDLRGSNLPKRNLNLFHPFFIFGPLVLQSPKEEFKLYRNINNSVCIGGLQSPKEEFKQLVIAGKEGRGKSSNLPKRNLNPFQPCLAQNPFALQSPKEEFKRSSLSPSQQSKIRSNLPKRNLNFKLPLHFYLPFPAPISQRGI